jgi:N-methylhydantoinase B
VGHEFLELEVFRALFASIAEEMGLLLQRSAASPNIKERRDFSCALFTPKGELFSQAAHIPVHLGSAPLSVRAALAEHRFEPGDAVLLNDPYRGGTHLPDLTLVQPVFCGARRPTFLVATRAHHADIGGAQPGSMAPAADLVAEGLCIPPVLLRKGDTFQRDVLRMLYANVRTPQERQTDLLAQCAANDKGVERLGELVERYGRTRLIRAADQLLAYGERRMEALLHSLPDGRYSFDDLLDDDGLGGVDLMIALDLTIRGRRATLDFRRTDDQARGSVNANDAITRSAVLYAFQCLIEDDLPPNEGMARPLRILLRRGSLLDPRPGAAVAAGNVETSQRLVDVLFGALAGAAPGRVPAASQGTMNNLAIGSTAGSKPFSYYETTGGGAGATRELDGASGIQVHMTNTLNTPIEALEHAYPLKVTRTHIVAGSGGAGARRGGDGLVREIEVLVDARISVLSDRRRRGPYGLAGGGAGEPGKNWIVRGGRRFARPGKFSEELARGDRVGFQTPGGGGYGTPGSDRS